MEKASVGAVSPATLDEIRPFIEMALQYEGSGVMCIEDFRGMHLFKCLDSGGNIIGGYALTVAQWIHAKVVWVMVAAGQSREVDLTRSFLPVIEAQARQMGAARVQLLTVRPGLKKRLALAGYEGAGQVFGKGI